MAECGEDFLLDEPIDDVEDSDDESIDDDEPIDDFPANFKEYMERELKYSRLEISDKPPGYKSRSSESWKGIRWVFWNPQDDDLTLSYDHSVDIIPDVCASRKVRLDVRLALRKLILHPELSYSLVQFWASTKTREGRTLLTTQFQPFAIGSVGLKRTRHWLCEYRMGMCREYNNYFYADAESGEEQLGLPGRVFLNKLPESTPDVEHYTLKEYPQRDLALHCKIRGSWAVPVFEHSSLTCVGVLEFVSGYNMSNDWFDKQFPGSMYDIFQDFGLLCFDGYKHCKMQNGDKNKALTAAFQELEMACESVCKTHKLPLALAWASCHSCDDLLQSQYQLSALEYVYDIGWEDVDLYSLRDFVSASRFYHLRKGQVTGRILQHPNLLYCSDVKQFSIAESPLVPYARLCELSGWFTMCLQGRYTGDELYVLEFFLPESEENDENILTKLRLILGTMEEYFETFKLASGQELGEVLSVEVINFQNYQRSHSIQKIPATKSIPSLKLLEDGGGVILQQGQLDQPSMDPSSNRQNVVTAKRNILVASSSKVGKRKMQDREHKKVGVRIEVPVEEILKCSNMKRNSAARKLNVSISTLKRVCRNHDIHRWPPRNIEKVQPFLSSPVEDQVNSDLPLNEASGSVANIKTGFQGADMVTIRAKCEKYTIKFCLSLSSRLVELQQEVAKRLNLRAETYRITYKDEKDELILITLDEDLQGCIQSFRSVGKNDIYITLEQL